MEERMVMVIRVIAKVIEMESGRLEGDMGE